MSYSTPVHLRVFLSSPGDVADERNLARLVLRKLEKERIFKGKIDLEEVSWDDPDESHPMDAHLTPQEAINRNLHKPSACDIVVVILWSRIGTPLPNEYLKPDGSPYCSGTEYEFLDAITGAESTGKPSVWVYRRDEELKVGSKDPKRHETLRQVDAVEVFFAEFKDETGAIRRSSFRYTSPSEFQSLFEGHLRDRISQLLEEMATQSVTQLDSSRPTIHMTADQTGIWHGNPYRGLDPFGPGDTAIFFGRGLETDELVKRVRDGVRVLALIGASGSGKSSLVAAGLWPRLTSGAIVGVAEWVSVRFTPAERGDNPFRALALKVIPLLPSGAGLTADKIAEKLSQTPAYIDEVAKLTLNGKPESAQLLLFADQFEELFTARVTEVYRASFINLVNAVASSHRVRLLLTLRSDYYEQCMAFPALATLLRNGSFPLTVPTGDELADMIEGPARVAGVKLELGLKKDLLKAVGNETGSLALLEFTLEQLYDMKRDDTLSRDAYRQLKGVPGAIQIQGEKAVHDKAGKVNEAALWGVFDALAEVDETGGALRRRAWKDAFNDLELSLVENLIGARILTSDKDEEGLPWVEVAHETVLRSWPRFTEWLRNNWKFKLWRKELKVYMAGQTLLRGIPLVTADDMLKDWKDYLTESERFYIVASRLAWEHEQAQERERQTRELDQQKKLAEEQALRIEEQQKLAAEQAKNHHRLRWALSMVVLSLLFVGIFAMKQYKAAQVDGEHRRPIYHEEEWVTIEPGKFCMGSRSENETIEECPGSLADPDIRNDEKPLHLVTITKRFRIAKHEITLEEYAPFAYDTGLGLPSNAGFGAGFDEETKKRLPIINVSWQDAQAYAAWLSGKTGQHFRLPTEAEWEYAARAGTVTPRFWDNLPDNACAYANVLDRQHMPELRKTFGITGKGFECDDPYATTAPVKSFRPNLWGFYDMAGNVWEWVADCYHESYEGAPTDGSPWEVQKGCDPGNHVFRGGSWTISPDSLRSATRGGYFLGTRHESIGFRLAWDF